MFIAGANFAVMYLAVRGRPGALLRDEELRAYTGIVLVASAALAAFLVRDGLGVCLSLLLLLWGPSSAAGWVFHVGQGIFV